MKVLNRLLSVSAATILSISGIHQLFYPSHLTYTPLSVGLLFLGGLLFGVLVDQTV